MNGTKADTESAGVYRGVVHVHSAYSHDGRDSIPDIVRTLSGREFDFCILTDHFEDFDAIEFERYKAEIADINAGGEFKVIPAIEAELEGVHVIFVPAGSYDEIEQVVEERDLSRSGAIKLLSHPTKYDLERTLTVLKDHVFNGVELWNQSADGKYAPPIDRLGALLPRMSSELCGYFFGSDIHDIRHSVVNYITIPADGPLTVDHVIEALRRGRHVSHNGLTGLTISGEQTSSELVAWLETAERSRGPRAVIMASLARVLKGIYHLLPRTAQRRINGLKNSIKNRL